MAITSIGQETSAFYTDAGVDPNTAGSFLSFNPGTGEYEYVGYQEMVERSSPDVTTTPSTPTIGDIFRQSSTGSSPLTGGPYSPVRDTPLEGNVHMAATGFGTAMTISDVLQSGKMMGPLGLGLTVYEGYTGFTEGVARAEAFEQAKAPDATIADMMSAFEHKPSIFDYAKDALGVGLSLFTGNIPGVVAAGIGLASTISAGQESQEAFERARDMSLEQTAEIGALQEQYGIGPTAATEMQQRQADFQRQTKANLEAASTEREDDEEAISFSPSTAVGTIGEALSSAFSSTSSFSNVSTIGGSRDGGRGVSSRGFSAASASSDMARFGIDVTRGDEEPPSRGFSEQSASSDRARFGIDVTSSTSRSRSRGRDAPGGVAGKDW